MKKTITTTIRANGIPDPRGHPAVRTRVLLWGGAAGVASGPSGRSAGTPEALELRDSETSAVILARRSCAGKQVLARCV